MRMKIVVAMDSMKGSLSSLRAGNAVKAGILRADPEAEVTVRLLADGGEGTLEALTAGLGGVLHRTRVTGPLGEPVEACFGVLADGVTAVVEMAQAAGLTLVPPERRDPLRATTYGLGQLIRRAAELGCRRFLVGIGGSATNDGGLGMLQALGFEFLDSRGAPLPFGALGLRDLAEIRTDRAMPELRACSFRVACDVDNPLCGERGCSAWYGPQKGARPEDIPLMDEWLGRYARRVAALFPGADPLLPGAGAAGGLGFAFLSFLNARLESGVRIVLEETRLEPALAQADLVITGEGRLDGQTVMGKAPIGVARMAKERGKPVLALAGAVTPEAAACNAAGIDAFFPILRAPLSLEQAMEPATAERNLADTAEQVFRLWKCAGA